MGVNPPRNEQQGPGQQSTKKKGRANGMKRPNRDRTEKERKKKKRGKERVKVEDSCVQPDYVVRAVFPSSSIADLTDMLK